MSTRRFLDSVGPTTDFSSFVASSRGISCDQAQQLIETWLKEYRPRTRLPINVLGADGNGDAQQRASTPA